MKVWLLQLVCVLALHPTAWTHPHGQEAPLTSIACNHSQVEAVADLSLRQLNAIRKEGFVLALKRITNVQKQYDDENGSVFYLTMDVGETECHVLSRQSWKDCRAKPIYEAVSGECKAIFQMHNTQRIAHLHNYNCTLKPDDSMQVMGCPGCLYSQPLNDTKVIEAATKSLEKFNRDSNHPKLFLLGNITKAATQVVAGKAYHVEYTILESSCNINAKDQSKCGPLDCEFAHSGYCKSTAVTQWIRGKQKSENTVSCDIFEPEAAIVERQHHASGHADDEPSSDKRPQKDKKKSDKTNPGHHEHDHKHLHHYEHHHDPDTAHSSHSSSPGPATTGTIIHLPREDAPDTPGSEDKIETEAKPSLDTPVVDHEKSFIRPFPDKASASEFCPGPPK